MDMSRYTILGRCLLNGTIRIIDGEYVGIAWDGARVGIGSVGRESYAEHYLHEHPTPSDW